MSKCNENGELAALELLTFQCQGSVTSLVRTLVENQSDRQARPEMGLVAQQALALADPVLDWEGAAKAAGYSKAPNGKICDARELQSDDNLDVEGWQSWFACCQDNQIEPLEAEPTEFWMVSQWLAGQLIALGEKVDPSFIGRAVWARVGKASILEEPAFIALAGDAELPASFNRWELLNVAKQGLQSSAMPVSGLGTSSSSHSSI